ncbi:uncharacterized protein [Haliotis asinina]|uniref:uncharacterized protein n=1 Tax=Haliotis asinina TaxID=109174 RepID=UPI0035327F39
MTSPVSTHAEDGPIQEVVPGGGQLLDVHFVTAQPQPDIHSLFPSCPGAVSEFLQRSHIDPELTMTATTHRNVPPYPTNIPIIVPLDSEDAPESNQQYDGLPPYPLSIPPITPLNTSVDISEPSDRHPVLPLFDGDGEMPSLCKGGHPMPVSPVCTVKPMQVLLEPASDITPANTHHRRRRGTVPQIVLTRPRQKGVNHVLHLVVSILFCPWLIFWMVLAQ